MVLVGAEGVVENGGVINKLGTYQLALCAKAHGIPFYVAAESYKVGDCAAQPALMSYLRAHEWAWGTRKSLLLSRVASCDMDVPAAEAYSPAACHAVCPALPTESGAQLEVLSSTWHLEVLPVPFADVTVALALLHQDTMCCVLSRPTCPQSRSMSTSDRCCLEMRQLTTHLEIIHHLVRLLNIFCPTQHL